MGHKAFFNALAATWDNMAVHEDIKLQTIATSLALEKGQTVLDIGTGTGVMIPYLRSWVGTSGEVVAVDISENMIKQAQMKFEGLAKFVTADVIALPFKDKTFERILCYSCFPHFSDKYRALVEMRRVLKSGGFIIIAHSQGREQINAFHKKLNNLVSDDVLPDDCQMIEIAQQVKLNVEFVRNDESMYILRLT